ncbi:MAG: sensor histidine kinase [Dysgonomonas sp.]
MKLTYKKRLFFWFFLIFFAFLLIMIVLEQKEEKSYRTQALESDLNNYTELIHKHIEKDTASSFGKKDLDDFLSVFPADMRVTVIKKDGTVLYDNDREINNIGIMGNHLDRPEIMNAFAKDFGSNIRLSASTDREYLYYAKYYDSYFVRVALPYNVEIKNILSPDRMFIYVALTIFVIGLILLNYVAGRFGKSISRLKTLTTDIKDGKPLKRKINFPDDELGEIGEQLTQIFEQKEKQEQKLHVERDKLIQHFQFSKNGLAIFNADRTKVYSNTRFTQYLNVISDTVNLDSEFLSSNETFRDVNNFLNSHKEGEKQNNFTVCINKAGKVFEVQAVVFEDNSFEIGIKDITEIEHTQQLKREMTDNIAHELRTPVTSLRGYLETLDTQDLAEEKRKQFIHRAYIQSMRLSNIVEDVSLINKMEESSSLFKLENINISQVINDVRIDLIDKLIKNNIELNLTLNDKAQLRGNYTLLYSIFRNLIDNTIEHTDSGTQIYINNYMEDAEYLYFSYYDTGKGVDEKYLNRLFERFYRADEGRTRETGGSGLGLSIVRNAVKFHHGEIQVKNRAGAGLEFLFTLHK